MSNPFTDVYDALWTLAESSQLLTSLVKIGNRIKLNSPTDYSKIKDEVSRADLPELMLISSGSSANLRNSSSSSMITRQYEWLISTGNINVIGGLLQTEWALFCAMADWPATLNALTWNNAAFVKRCNIISMSAGISDPERNRGIEGWSAIWGIEVEMHFRTSDLLNVNIGTGS